MNEKYHSSSSNQNKKLHSTVLRMSMMSAMMIGLHHNHDDDNNSITDYAHNHEQQQQQQQQHRVNNEDHRLSELVASSLNISSLSSCDVNNCDITHITSPTTPSLLEGGLYSNGLLNMTATATGINNNSLHSGMIVPTTATAVPPAISAADVGLLSLSCWDGWESRRRTECSSSAAIMIKKRNHQTQVRKLKRIQRKGANEKRVKVASLVRFRRRRLRLEHNFGRGQQQHEYHLDDSHGHLAKRKSTSALTLLDNTRNIINNNNNNNKSLPSFSSKAMLRRRRRKAKTVRFRDDYHIVATAADDTIEWKREKPNNKSINTSKLGLEFHREEKKSQRELLDLQVGMNSMGL